MDRRLEKKTTDRRSIEEQLKAIKATKEAYRRKTLR